EMALPPVGDRLASGSQLVAPGVPLAGQAPARGILPFGLGRQALARTRGVGHGVVPRDLGDRLARRGRRARAVGVTPVGAVRLAHPEASAVDPDHPLRPRIAGPAVLRGGGGSRSGTRDLVVGGARLPLARREGEQQQEGRRSQRPTSATATLFTPLQARYSLPSGVAAMLRTTPPPDGMTVDEKAFERGSNRTSVFGLTPDSLYQTMPSRVTVMP